MQQNIEIRFVKREKQKILWHTSFDSSKVLKLLLFCQLNFVIKVKIKTVFNVKKNCN